MPFLYIYAPSDFTPMPPSESGGAAAGRPPFSLTLAPGAGPVIVELDDTDGTLDEITSTGPQTLTNETTIGNVTYPAGTTYNAAYDLINTGTGHMVTSLHFGGDGSQQTAVQGIISSIPLVPGTRYTFNTERSSYQQDTPYEAYEDVPCFAAGTLIETGDGPVAIENIAVGDLVVTRDHACLPVRWIGSREVDAATLAARPALCPIRIRAGALGHEQPISDLVVSPQHRVLVRSRIAQRMFGAQEVLVAARQLLEIAGIERADDLHEVEYFHMMFDSHQIVTSNGAQTESLYAGARALSSIGSAARDEVLALFPELASSDGPPDAARPLIAGRVGRNMAARHVKNGVRLVG